MHTRTTPPLTAALVLPFKPLESQRRSPVRVWLPLMFAALGFLAVPFDLPIARWIDAGHCPADFGRLLHLAEAYAHGFGVFTILLTALVLDWPRRALFPRAFATVACAGLMADLLKMSLARTRPHAFSLSGNVIATFGHWLPMNRVPSDLQSFPSGHMAAAGALTAVLIWLYPRGRWLFICFAILAGGQRINSSAHFLSDVAWVQPSGHSRPAYFFQVAGPPADSIGSRRFSPFAGGFPAPFAPRTVDSAVSVSVPMQHDRG